MTTISIGIGPAQLRSLRHIAKVRGVSMASLVRGMIERETDNYIHVQIVGRPRLKVIEGGLSGPEVIEDTELAKAK